eukprot:554452_1
MIMGNKSGKLKASKKPKTLKQSDVNDIDDFLKEINQAMDEVNEMNEAMQDGFDNCWQCQECQFVTNRLDSPLCTNCNALPPIHDFNEPQQSQKHQIENKLISWKNSLESELTTLEDAYLNKLTLKAMKSSAITIQALVNESDIDKADELMEDINELIDQINGINELLTQDINKVKLSQYETIKSNINTTPINMSELNMLTVPTKADKLFNNSIKILHWTLVQLEKRQIEVEKKQLQNQLLSIRGKRLNLELQLMAMEDAKFNKKILQVMKNAMIAIKVYVATCDTKLIVHIDQQLRDTISELEKKEINNEKEIEICLNNAKRQAENKNKKAALYELKKKKQLENQLCSIQGKKINLEVLIMTSEDCHVNIQALIAMKPTVKQIDLKQTDLNKYNELMQQINNGMRQVNDGMNLPYSMLYNNMNVNESMSDGFDLVKQAIIELKEMIICVDELLQKTETDMNIERKVYKMRERILNVRKLAVSAMKVTIKDSDLDKADELMEDINEGMDQICEMNELLCAPMGEVFDDEALQREIEELEMLEAEELMNKNDELEINENDTKINDSNDSNANENVNSVSLWLTNELELPEYIDVFVENGYDDLNVILKTMSDDELKEIGINKRGHRKKIMLFINERNSNESGSGMDLKRLLCKPILSWSNNDVLQWINSINFSNKWKKMAINAIKDGGVTGKHIEELKCKQDVIDIFDVNNPMLYNRLWVEIKKIKTNNDNNNNNKDVENVSISNWNNDKVVEWVNNINL